MTLLFVFTALHAQLTVLQYRAVPQENIDEFLHRETTYWSAVAQKSIDEGKMLEWALWQRIGGVNLDESSHNFVFVNVLPTNQPWITWEAYGIPPKYFQTCAPRTWRRGV